MIKYTYTEVDPKSIIGADISDIKDSSTDAPYFWVDIVFTIEGKTMKASRAMFGKYNDDGSIEWRGLSETFSLLDVPAIISIANQGTFKLVSINPGEYRDEISDEWYIPEFILWFSGEPIQWAVFKSKRHIRPEDA
jgi:hypothetical protein